MPNEIDRSWPSNADLSGKIYHFVKLLSTGKVDVCAATTDKPIGILQNKPTAGQAAIVRVTGESQVSAAGTIAVGDTVGTDVNGQAATYVEGTDTTKYRGGICTVATDGATSENGRVMLQLTGRLA